jgi:hypothetical protein
MESHQIIRLELINEKLNGLKMGMQDVYYEADNKDGSDLDTAIAHIERAIELLNKVVK